jgi:hypothetical protein
MATTRERDFDFVRFANPTPQVVLVADETPWGERSTFDLLHRGSEDVPATFGLATPSLLASSRVYGVVFVGTPHGESLASLCALCAASRAPGVSRRHRRRPARSNSVGVSVRRSCRATRRRRRF